MQNMVRILQHHYQQYLKEKDQENTMFLTIEHRVTYKESPKERQVSVTFPTKEAANAFALAVETDGGIAVVTSSFIKSLSTPSYIQK
jgi:hypothetical protein